MNQITSQRIGLIAGAGDVPVYFARKAFQKGIKLVSIAFSDEIDSTLHPYVEKHYSIGIGQSDKIFRTLKKENITGLLLMGKVEKSMVFQLQMFDLRSLKFLNRIRNRKDKTLMTGIIRECEQEGLTVLDQKEFLSELFPEKGVLTKRKPTPEEWQDVEFGFSIARTMADMEIGQTIVVKNKTVVAVEGVEGTDQTLKRGCDLAGEKCVALKVSRTDQDYRYDAPGIGLKTIEYLTRGKAAVLAVEAQRVMIVDQPRVVELADQAGLSIVAV